MNELVAIKREQLLSIQYGSAMVVDPHYVGVTTGCPVCGARSFWDLHNADAHRVEPHQPTCWIGIALEGSK